MSKRENTIRVALIGAGAFGALFALQAERNPHMELVVVSDTDADKAAGVLESANPAPESLAVCKDASAAEAHLREGRRVVLPDSRHVASLSVDVVVEATGDPESGALNAKAAIECGKHVVMVNKEADSVVGPILFHEASQNGVRYLWAAGDQPAALCELIDRASADGLPVVAAGKASERDFVYRDTSHSVTNGVEEVVLSEGRQGGVLFASALDPTTVVASRARALRQLPPKQPGDFTEMAIVANATGLGFDVPELHAPILHVTEVAGTLKHERDGGILSAEGCLDLFTCLRKDGQAGMAGGVFVVVGCPEDAAPLLRQKGHLLDDSGTRLFLYCPYHLLGLQTPFSVLAAARNLKAPPFSLTPQVDVVGRATHDIPSGTPLRMTSDRGIVGANPLLHPAAKLDSDTPVPFYLLPGSTTRRDVPAGSLITLAHVEVRADSSLLELRQQQDHLFFRS